MQFTMVNGDHSIAIYVRGHTQYGRLFTVIYSYHQRNYNTQNIDAIKIVHQQFYNAFNGTGNEALKC